MREDSSDLGFTYRVVKSGDVMIHHHAKLSTILRKGDAQTFIKKAETADFAAQQQLMARATGNYKRGNERVARNHFRNQ